MPHRQTLHTFYPTFNARGKLRVHYSLPQPQQVFEMFHLPPGVGTTSVVSISRARAAARQRLRAALGCAGTASTWGERREQNSCAPSPNFISLSSCTCRAGGANWASLTKKMPSMKSQEGNNHPAELCQVWPWGCRSLTWVKFSASSSTDQKDPAAPPIQATKLDI